ncbi:MAG: acyl-CoA dehydrogenase [Janthinobacterium lividum]
MAETVLPTDEERQMLRDSVRGFLEQYWPAATAVERASDPKAVAEIWQKLAELGLATLGTDPSEGGLREIAIVMEELGRAACPAPVLGAVLTNLALTDARTAHAEAATLLDTLHGGDARISFSFGEFDPDPNVGRAVLEGGKLSGTLRFVEGGHTATHLLVAVGNPTALAVVDCNGAGVSFAETRALGGMGLAEAVLDGANATLVPVASERLADLSLIFRVCLQARAHGAARRSFEMVVDYAKERKQFGKPIGSFQAIQHKLANCLISLEGARLTVHNAAANYDYQIADWRYFAAAAFAFASPALRQVSIETQHAFGAIGYAEEHEAPRHFKRVHTDMILHGGQRAAREQVAGYVFAGGDVLPKYDMGEAGNALRESVRQWLDEHWSGERKQAYDKLHFHDREFDPSFAKDIGKTPWLGLSWPKSEGGLAGTPLQQLAFFEEMERAEAPRAGATVQANALILFGTAAQKAKYLPEMLHGEAMHGMGYSEPDAGSDLASLRTSAVRDGDEWVINGQKIWTTTWWGKYMFLAARTDAAATPKHAGISMFVVPMDSPGITVKPAKTMYDGSFANIFYDNVRLPADALVGEVNGGWKVLTSALATERGLIGGGIVLKVVHLFEMLCAEVKQAKLDADPLVRQKIAELAADIEVGRQLMVYCAAMIVDGATPPELGAISKVFSGELMERIGEAALDILGTRAALSEGMPGRLSNGKFEQGLRHSLMWVISIGTNEIQRTLIAQRGLNLPR